MDGTTLLVTIQNIFCGKMILFLGSLFCSFPKFKFKLAHTASNLYLWRQYQRMMTGFIHGLGFVRQLYFAKEIKSDSSLNLIISSASPPMKLSIAKLKMIFNNCGRDVPSLLATHKNKIKTTIKPFLNHFLNIAHALNEPSILLSLSMSSTPPIKLLDAYCFKVESIRNSTKFAPLHHFMKDI